ncbi:response regulator transcription factor [Egicoccus sp. AB-alg2]|uniref:response regulator transcription factor n=1 Tax=Egicoccus sp. AB-alg2 TaxID=3242693 RepID=UPI00359D7AAE
MAHTVVIVDDHEVVRQGLRRALERVATDCEVVGEAGTVAEARTVVAATDPDVAILDVVLPDGDGIQLCRELRASHPNTACLLLTSFPDPRGLLSAALAGAGAYLGKDSRAADLAETVALLAKGGTLLPPDTVPELLDKVTGTVDEDPRVATLTDQERRVFELIGQGLSNRQIAERLFLAERTVKNYTTRLLDKLQMERRTEAAALAARLAERRAQSSARQPPSTSNTP